jgi:hypothetical protein
VNGFQSRCDFSDSVSSSGTIDGNGIRLLKCVFLEPREHPTLKRKYVTAMRGNNMGNVQWPRGEDPGKSLRQYPM